MSFECSACTFFNENPYGLACIMCHTERRRIATAAPPQITMNEGEECGRVQTPASDLDDDAPATLKKTSSRGKKSNLPSMTLQLRAKKLGEDDAFHSQHCDDRKVEPSAQPSREELGAKFTDEAKAPANKTKATAGGGNAKWDAFASLESNYQSSDDEEGDEWGACHRDTESREGNSKKANDAAGSAQWDAFKSFEQNYESSEEEEFSSGEDSEGESECSHADIEEVSGMQGEWDDNPSLNKQGKKSSINAEMEFVDLVDSDEEEDSVCEVDVKMMPGKENNTSDKPSSRLRKRPQKQQPETIDVGSDSSLSEVESRRPLPSPSARPLPSWQRRRSTPIRSMDTLKASDSYACMTSRNDVIGGSGAGVNGFRLGQREGGDSEVTASKSKPRKSSKKASSTSAGGRSKKTSASASKTTAASATSKTRKRKAPAKKRRKRSYKRKSNRQSTGSAGAATNNNNVWSARERGIRQPYRRRSTGGEYMAIAKQEPMLRNVGGASIQF